jgi:hypothetical protein
MPDPLATLTDRLFADYQPGITHPDIDRIVQQCRTDLAGTPDTALPELLERLPRQRLTTCCNSGRTAGAGAPPKGACRGLSGRMSSSWPHKLVHLRLRRQFWSG